MLWPLWVVLIAGIDRLCVYILLFAPPNLHVKADAPV